jgi:hypothetical protein
MAIIDVNVAVDESEEHFAGFYQRELGCGRDSAFETD